MIDVGAKAIIETHQRNEFGLTARQSKKMPERLVLVEDKVRGGAAGGDASLYGRFCAAFDELRAAGNPPADCVPAEHVYIITLPRRPANTIVDVLEAKGVLEKLGAEFKGDLKLLCDNDDSTSGSSGGSGGAVGRGGAGAGAESKTRPQNGGDVSAPSPRGAGVERGVSIFYVGETIKGATKRAKGHRSSGKYLGPLAKVRKPDGSTKAVASFGGPGEEGKFVLSLAMIGVGLEHDWGCSILINLFPPLGHCVKHRICISPRHAPRCYFVPSDFRSRAARSAGCGRQSSSTSTRTSRKSSAR